MFLSRSSSDDNSEIEVAIRAHHKKMQSEFKLLLLGSGDSGKSTILKQLTILHKNGFKPAQLFNMRNAVFSNLLSSLKTLCIQAEKFDIKLDGSNQRRAESILEFSDENIGRNPDELLTKELRADIQALCKDEGLASTWKRRSEFQILDNAIYFMENVDRIMNPEYCPTQDDVVRVRVKTIGCTETTIEPDKGVTFRLVDVGGQRCERRKWLHVFDDVTAVIFVVSLSEYNQTLFEDQNVNRMHESLALFDDVCNSREFKDTPIIILFNKLDLFADKIHTVDIGYYFPEYKGGLDYEAGLSFIKDSYTRLNKNPHRQIYTHLTCATSTNNIEVVFRAVKDIITQCNLSDL